MMRIFLGILWIAVFRATYSTELCQPELVIENTTLNSFTIRWWCKNNITEQLEGIYLKHTSADTHRPDYIHLGSSQGQYTHRARRSRYAEKPTFQVSIIASHKEKNITDESEEVEISLVRCSPVLVLQQGTLSTTTVNWECNNTIPDEIKGYQLLYQRYITGKLDDWTTVKFNLTQREYTLTEMNCSSTYTIIVEAVYKERGIYDYSNPLEVIPGGPLNSPKSEDFLEVGETSVTVKLNQWKSNCRLNSFNMELKAVDMVNVTRTNASVKQLEFIGLRPNTIYTLQVGFNDDRYSERISYTVKTLCEKKAPKIPRESQLLKTERRYFVIQLHQWECVDSFSVEYRETNSMTWNLIAGDIKAEQESLVIQGLSTGSEYVLRITANNSAGSTVAEYKLLPDVHVCGDWTEHCGKCIKIIKEAGLLVKSEAQVVCQKFKEYGVIPSLLTVKNEEEHQMLSQNKNLPDRVWLGLHSEESGAFSWDDGSEVSFSNWANQSADDKELRCAKMMVEYLSVYEEASSFMLLRGNGRRYINSPFITWSRASCGSRNYVVCEKLKPKPFLEQFDELVDTVPVLKTWMTEAENRISALEKK